HVAATLLQAGKNVTISSFSAGYTSSYADNVGGGFVHVGDSDAKTSFANTNLAYVGTDSGGGVFDAAGMKILAGGHFKLSAESSLNTHVTTSSDGGGFIASASATSTGDVGGDTHVIVGRNADIEAESANILANYSALNVKLDAEATAG